MAFNTLSFLLFFLVVLGLHNLPLGWKAKKVNLLVASYVFYAAWSPPFILLLWISTLVDWMAGRKIAETTGTRRTLFLLVSIFVNLGFLAYFKYGAFLEANFSALVQYAGINYEITPSIVILPLGISFYTFQSMSYSIDIYRGNQKPHDSALDFALYVAFFPQLVAGPILRAGFFLQQMADDYSERLTRLGWGFALITVGLFEKIVLADGLLAPVAEKVYSAATEASTVDAWIGTMAFSGQIFFDFNGYSVIAVGLGCCLGFKLPWNFLSPYAAVGFSDFWRRWHTTLSSWLRDYLYIPLSGNRGSAIRTVVNLMITMLIGGLWHGASWLFVAWGGAHGLLLIAERMLRKYFGSARLWHTGAGKLLLGLATWVCVCLTWVLFRADGPDAAYQLLGAMAFVTDSTTQLSTFEIWQVGLVVVGLLGVHWFMRERDFEATANNMSSLSIVVSLTIMIVAILLAPGEERAFIYFEF